MKQRFTNPGVAKTKMRSGIIACMSLLLSFTAGAQQQLRLDAASYPEMSKGPAIKPLTAMLSLNTKGRTQPTDISVTASFIAQQFTNVSGNTTGTGMQFGATQNTSSTAANGQAVWTPMENVSNPEDNLFSASASGAPGSGVDVAANYAFSILCTTRPLAAAGLSTGGRHLMGQLKLSFNKPVSNPVLHVVGLGATAGALGITTELELAGNGITLSKLSGNGNLDITQNAILNSAANPDASSYTGAATGSIAVNGSDITELVFNVFMKGDGGAAVWEQSNQYNGDRWLIGLSLPSAKTTISMPLPIYVTDFNVTHEEACSATIRWKTSTELGVTDFYIEQSTNGVDFNVIYSLPSGGTAQGDYYAYTYRHATNGANYFRIRTHDILSDSNYGGIVRVLVTCDEHPIEVFPNPAQNFVKINGATTGEVVQLSNMFGKLQQTKKLTSPNEFLDVSSLQPGIYVLVVSNEQGQEISRTRINKQ